MGCSVRTDRVRYTEWRNWISGEVMARELYDNTQEPAEVRSMMEVYDKFSTLADEYTAATPDDLENRIAAAKAALANNKKVEDAALEGGDLPDTEADDDDALEDTDDLADEADDIEVEVEDDKGEGDR